jgi:hypothetical protein
MGQTTTKAIPVPVDSAAPTRDSAEGTGDLSSQLVHGQGTGAIELFLYSLAGGTFDNVRLSLREDDEWSIVGQQGLGINVLDSLTLEPDTQVKFAYSLTGRPTHAKVSCDVPGDLTAKAKAIYGRSF